MLLLTNASAIWERILDSWRAEEFGILGEFFFMLVNHRLEEKITGIIFGKYGGQDRILREFEILSQF